MRLVFRRILSCIGTIIILVIGLCYCNRLVINKSSYEKYEPFFNSEQDFDVLFFGSSHVHRGISPLYLYKKYGITSYNMSTLANYIASNTYCIEETLRILQKQKRNLPKIIVVDIYADKDSVYQLHRRWDAFPISFNKVKLINDLVEEKDRVGMFIPFSLYHSRWNEVTMDDFRPDVNKYYGEGELYNVSYPEKEIITDPLDQTAIDVDTADYLERIKMICEELDIQLILIHIPYSYTPDLQRVANGICQYEKEQGVMCVNYMNEEIGIDYDIDFFDTGHLNIAGMRIMTNELGKLLSDCGLEDHRGELEAEQWNQAYEEYTQFRITKLKEIKDAKTYLMAINDSDLISTVQIYKGMLGDIQFSKLIERLKAEGHQIIVTEERPEITIEEGRAKDYDVYCEVYRRNNVGGGIVHSIGFTL